MRKNYIGTVFACLLALVLLVQIPAGTAAASGTQSSDSSAAGATSQASGISTVTTEGYDIVLLIDKSGSMNATDKNRLALSAACQFVDQLCTMSSDLVATSKVGVMAFSQETEVISVPVELNSEVNTDYLKSAIQNIQYDTVNTGGTDLGTAVYDAAELLRKQSSDGRKRMIVLFTDGHSENVYDEQVSQANLQEAFSIASDLECEFFIVGLNQDNKITDEGQDEIHYIADTAQLNDGIEDAAADDTYATKDKVNYLITDNIGDVRKFYGQIVALMMGGITETIDNHQFSIPSGGIIEADVTVYANSSILSVTVTDPDGNQQIEDGESYFVSGDSYYKVIKILNPEVGTWTLEVTTEDESYNSYVLKFYGIEAAISASWDDASAFADANVNSSYVGQVVLTPMYKGEVYEDESLAESITTAEFTASTDSSSETYTLSYESGQFIGYFPVETGEYEIEATIATDSMSRTVSCELSVNTGITAGPDGYLYDLGTITVKRGRSITLNLSQRTGVESLTIQGVTAAGSASGTGGKQILSTDYQDASLTITGLRTGSDELTITALDDSGNQWEISGTVQVEFAFLWYHYLLILLVILLVIFLIRFLIRKGQKAQGTFIVTITNNDPDSQYCATSVDRDIRTYPGGAQFSLWELSDIIMKNCQSRNPMLPEEEEICRLLEEEKSAIKKYKLKIAENQRGRKIYKLDNGKGNLRDLRTAREQYRSGKLNITIGFESIWGDDDGGDFGRPTDNRKKKTTHGRQASGKAKKNR